MKTPDNEAEVASRDLFTELADWVEYTEARAKELGRLAKENEKYPEAHARLETKAGCYRSLAVEVQRILKENAALPSASRPPSKSCI